MAKQVILFESYPDFNGSALEIYNELVKRGYDKKYDLIWAVYSDFKLKTKYRTVKFFNCESAEKAAILARTKCIIDSNRYIKKPSAGIFRFHVRHGCCLKNSINYNRKLGDVDAILTTSDEMLKLDQQIFAPEISKKFVVLGMPATDRLFSPKPIYDCGLIKEMTGSDHRYAKLIGWLPTFRDHRNSHFGKNRFPFGLPAIHSDAEFRAVNDILVKHDALLIVQMHHAQAKNYKNPPKCSNIAFVNEAMKAKCGVATTDILGNCDALLTDYSSAYHEYVILNRPIGLIVEDLLAYSNTKGFFCNYLDWIKGDYIINNNMLVNWINNIANGLDVNKAAREVSLNKIHKFKDANAAKRAVDYLVKAAHL
jgi:CDP-glycerol glycerophosphotransferase (TagB/SpsB family)